MFPVAIIVYILKRMRERASPELWLPSRRWLTLFVGECLIRVVEQIFCGWIEPQG